MDVFLNGGLADEVGVDARFFFRQAKFFFTKGNAFYQKSHIVCKSAHCL